MENPQIRMFAQRLADNIKPTRDKALKMLRKHFKIRSSLGECVELDDMLNIWKGLFYSMYMSDKSLTQEALAEDISKLLHTLTRHSDKKCFIEAAFQTFAREWHGIDVFRIDKMMMFVRRMLRQSLMFLKALDWCKEEAVQVVDILERSVICPLDNTNARPLGLKLHFCDIYLEEIAKVGNEAIDHNIILLFLQPYIKVLAMSTIDNYVTRVTESVMQHLIRQSDLGIAHTEGIDEEEEEDESSEEQEDGTEQPMDEDDGGEDDRDMLVLDPRAGGIDVHMPQLDVNFENLADDLQCMGGLKEIKQKKRALLYKLAKQMRDVSEGVYPFALPTEKDLVFPNLRRETKRAVQALQKFDKKLQSNCGIGKKRKRTNNAVSGSKEKADESMEADVLAETLESTLEWQPKKKIKRKNKSKKNKNKDKAIDNQELRKKKAELKESVDKGLKVIREKAGIPSSKNYSPNKKKRLSVEFMVTDIDNSDTADKNKLINICSSPVTAMDTSSDVNNTITNSSPGWNVDFFKQKDKVKKPLTNTNTITLNLSLDKDKQLGFEPKNEFSSSWDEPLKEGEYEYVVKSRKQILKEKKGGKSKKSPMKEKLNKKRRNRSLSFNLEKNKEHLFSDYTKSIRNSPSIPYHADKQPSASVLKPSSSPILIRKPLLKVLSRSKSPKSLSTPRVKKLKRLSMPTFVV